MGKLIKKSIKMSTGGKVDLDKRRKPRPVQVMPDPEDPALDLVRKRRIAEQQKRGGRVSTILTGGDSSTGSGFGG